MPLVPFDSLPADARVWVFASDRAITGPKAERLLAETDRFLRAWQAHGNPLTCGRAWTENHFLTVGVDQSTAGASGCSIDGLFRALRGLEPAIGASLVAGGRVHYRDPTGEIRSVSRGEFGELAKRGAITGGTRVFDPTITSVGDWRSRFERQAAESWHAQLM